MLFLLWVMIMAIKDREKEILQLLEKKYSISVKELAKSLYISESTIRRDLISLEKKHLIVHSYGKVSANKLSADLNIAFSDREQLMYNVKSSLAKAAVELIHDGNVIMLDASSTASHIIKFLENFKDLIVITSGLKTAYMLCQTDIPFLSTGGNALNKSFSLVGQTAINTVQTYNADICFISCHGVSESGMVTDNSVLENDLRRQMLKQSKIKVLIIDNTKINQGCWHNLCDISEFDEVYCNEPLPPLVTAKIKHFNLIAD